MALIFAEIIINCSIKAALNPSLNLSKINFHWHLGYGDNPVLSNYLHPSSTEHPVTDISGNAHKNQSLVDCETRHNIIKEKCMLNRFISFLTCIGRSRFNFTCPSHPFYTLNRFCIADSTRTLY